MKPEIELCADVLVIGTGLAGICASVQAARLGCSIILLEKGRTLGGNSGPEVGVHSGGVRSYHPYASETGIMGEILEEAAWIRAKTWTKRQHYNISQLWDSVLNKKLSDAGVNVMRCHYARTVNMQDNKIVQRIIESIKEYLEEHCSEDLNLADIAIVLFLPEPFFKKETGYNLMEYLNMVRIEKAKILLKDPLCKIYEVGYKVGIEDNQYFSRIFRKITGISPSEIRNGS